MHLTFIYSETIEKYSGGSIAFIQHFLLVNVVLWYPRDYWAMHSMNLFISIIADDELSMKTKKFPEYKTWNYNEGCSYQEN